MNILAAAHDYSVEFFIPLLIRLAVIGLILFIVWWVIQKIPMPEPIKTVVVVIFYVVCAIIAINVLLAFL